MSTIIEKGSNLRLIQANEGMLLFKKKDTNRSYFTEAYMAKSETQDDYGEVTYDYAYGLSIDKEYIELKENYKKLSALIELQSDVLDSLLFSEYKSKEINKIEEYVTMRVIEGNIDYKKAIEKYPNIKEKIDNELNK